MDSYDDIYDLTLKKWIKRPEDPAPHIAVVHWDYNDTTEFHIGRKEDNEDT